MAVIKKRSKTSEKKQATGELARVDQQLKDLARFPQENPNPVLRVDRDGAILSANNACSLLDFNCQLGQVLPRHYLKIVAEVLESGLHQVIEAKGREGIFSLNFIPITGAGCVNIYGNDITERKRAEEALQETQKDMKRAQAVAQTGSWRMDVQRNRLLWSEETHRMFGIPKGTPMTYETFLSCVHPEDRDYVDRKWQAALQGEGYDIEHRIIVDGKVKWVREKAELEFDKQGMLKGGFGTAQDITGRVLAEETIKQAAQQWQETFDAIPDLVSIHDRDYNIVKVNKAFTKTFGMTAEQLVGKKCYEVFHKSKEPTLACPHQQTIETGQSTVEEIFEPSRNAYLDVSTAPIINASGEITGSVHIVRDITERKKVEENLRQTRDYLDNLFTYANAPIIVWDPELKITRFNHAFERLTGRSAGEVLGEKVDILIPADERDEALKKINCTTKMGERWEVVEIPIQHVDGSVRTVLWNSATLYTLDGKTPVATIAQGQDITELKKTDKMKDEFIGLVSHELRTPLTVITGSLRSAMSPGISPEDARELLQNAVEGADQLAAILENMLELSRYQADRLQLRMELVNIADEAQGVVERLKGRGAEQRFSVDFPPNLPLVEADTVRVERILYNLLENAVKYSPVQSEVKVSGRRKGDFVITAVSDQGKGIPGGEQGKLFELFRRLEESSYAKGAGLGLVVCKRLVEAQGGWIKVDSALGKGSTFTFALPIRRARA
jgi:PAS domain S-box-containing protein